MCQFYKETLEEWYGENHINWLKHRGSNSSSACKRHGTRAIRWARNTCSMKGVNNSDRALLGDDEMNLKGGERHRVFKSTHWPKLIFHALTAHSASAHFHRTIFTCGLFVRLKTLQRNMRCLHVNGSHTGNVTSLIFCIKLRRSPCQLQISPLYPADKRQSNKVYNREVKH